MKTRWLILTALCVLLAGPAVAQSTSTPKMEVYVPFNFVVNGTSLPAGKYVNKYLHKRTFAYDSKQR